MYMTTDDTKLGSILRHQRTFVICMEKTFQWSGDKTGGFMASFLPYSHAYELYVSSIVCCYSAFFAEITTVPN